MARRSRNTTIKLPLVIALPAVETSKRTCSRIAPNDSTSTWTVKRAAGRKSCMVESARPQRGQHARPRPHAVKQGAVHGGGLGRVFGGGDQPAQRPCAPADGPAGARAAPGAAMKAGVPGDRCCIEQAHAPACGSSLSMSARPGSSCACLLAPQAKCLARRTGSAVNGARGLFQQAQCGQARALLLLPNEAAASRETASSHARRVPSPCKGAQRRRGRGRCARC
jgi:hypothetical protein